MRRLATFSYFNNPEEVLAPIDDCGCDLTLIKLTEVECTNLGIMGTGIGTIADFTQAPIRIPVYPVFFKKTQLFFGLGEAYLDAYVQNSAGVIHFIHTAHSREGCSGCLVFSFDPFRIVVGVNFAGAFFTRWLDSPSYGIPYFRPNKAWLQIGVEIMAEWENIQSTTSQ